MSSFWFQFQIIYRKVKALQKTILEKVHVDISYSVLLIVTHKHILAHMNVVI